MSRVLSIAKLARNYLWKGRSNIVEVGDGRIYRFDGRKVEMIPWFLSIKQYSSTIEILIEDFFPTKRVFLTFLTKKFKQNLS